MSEEASQYHNNDATIRSSCGLELMEEVNPKTGGYLHMVSSPSGLALSGINK